MGRMHAVKVPWLSGPPLRQLEELAAWGELLRDGMSVAQGTHSAIGGPQRRAAVPSKKAVLVLACQGPSQLRQPGGQLACWGGLPKRAVGVLTAL